VNDDRPKHPSGFPIRESRERKLPFTRIPNDGPLTPRLRLPRPRDAIGFHHLPCDNDDEEF
jgi:hypothetical protein